jgi:hypothetical protein
MVDPDTTEMAAAEGAEGMKPRLTSRIVRGLRTVRSDAASMLEERQGHGEDSPTDADQECALAWLEALIAWHEEKAGTESEPAAPPPVAVAVSQSHDPDCVFPDGHNGACVLASELADVDPQTGHLLSRGAVKAAQTRLERTKKNPR